MPSIQQFIWDLKLDKTDETKLFEHVRECSVSSSGPSLEDRCSNRVRATCKTMHGQCCSVVCRKFLKAHPPLDLSWHAEIRLQDELSSGFTSKEAYQMGIPAIGVVATLIASIAFSGWVNPPGGSSPYWVGCSYPIFTAFLIVNGAAFMLSVASVVVITAFPLLLKRTPHQAAWWGGILLLMSMLAFIAAFVLAGFITVRYSAPLAGCSSLRCRNGGIPCLTEAYLPQNVSYGYYWLDQNVAALNDIINTSNGTAWCVTYNRSVVNGGITMLYPAAPYCAYDNIDGIEDTCAAVRQLLEDPVTQQGTVCMDSANFPAALRSPDSTTLALSIGRTIPNLTDWFVHNPFSDILSLVDAGQDLYAYSALDHVCISNATHPHMQFDVLCDITTGITRNLSISKSGQYMTEATAASFGATVFNRDSLSMQVAIAVKVMCGFFALNLLVIAVFLARSKFQ